MRQSAVPNELGALDPDYAFDLGYEAAIFDLVHRHDEEVR
jgi:hypothetical protein